MPKEEPSSVFHRVLVRMLTCCKRALTVRLGFTACALKLSHSQDVLYNIRRDLRCVPHEKKGYHASRSGAGWKSKSYVPFLSVPMRV